MLHRQMRDLDAAELFLERAQENYESCGTVEERIATELERSLTIRDQGDIYRALAIAELALTRSRSIENTRLIAEALRCVGIPLADHGNFADARMFFQEGLGLSGVSGNQLLNGELNEELAILELAEGDLLNSALYLEAARKMYLQLGCASRAERATYRYNQFDQKNLQLGHRHT
jgi:cytidylate kinase